MATNPFAGSLVLVADDEPLEARMAPRAYPKRRIRHRDLDRHAGRLQGPDRLRTNRIRPAGFVHEVDHHPSGTGFDQARERTRSERQGQPGATIALLDREQPGPGRGRDRRHRARCRTVETQMGGSTRDLERYGPRVDGFEDEARERRMGDDPQTRFFGGERPDQPDPHQAEQEDRPRKEPPGTVDHPWRTARGGCARPAARTAVPEPEEASPGRER